MIAEVRLRSAGTVIEERHEAPVIRFQLWDSGRALLTMEDGAGHVTESITYRRVERIRRVLT